MADDVARDLGAVEARLDNHEKRLDKIDGKLDELLEYAAKTKGGWWALATVGGVGGAIGAAAVKLLGAIKGGG